MKIAKSLAPSPQPPVPTQLPVEALRIGSDTAALLHELGIETIDQLLSLPRDGLASRFGDELLRRLDQLAGVGREVIEPHRGRAALEASHALEEPTGDRAVLMRVLERLVKQLARQLAARDQGAALLMCLLHLVGGTPDPAPGKSRLPGARSAMGVVAGTKSDPRPSQTQGVPPQLLRVGLLQPSANPQQLLELIELHLEKVRLTGEVDRVEIRAAVVGRLGEQQGELFADRWLADPHQLAVLVNRLSSRLGYERVLQAELRASPVPERAVAWMPVTGSKAKELKRKDRETRRQGDKEKRWKSNSPCLPLSPSSCLSPRPLLLYPRPQPIEVVCVAPDGPLQFVWLQKRRERIVHYAGPERIETLWWRGPSVRRDYYRVATESGSHLWIFRRLADGKWFLHGTFV